MRFDNLFLNLHSLSILNSVDKFGYALKISRVINSPCSIIIIKLKEFRDIGLINSHKMIGDNRIIRYKLTMDGISLLKKLNRIRELT